MKPLAVCLLEIPFELTNKWDDMLTTSGRSATYWEIAKWAYEKGQAEECDRQAE